MSTSAPRDWDAAVYDRVSTPQQRWGQAVLDRLRLRGDERVLDAGCGTGRVTAHLLERLPRGQVIGVDASPRMLAEARRRLAPYGERVTLLQADLSQPLPTEGTLWPVDAILSTATFHWLRDHATLFRHLAAVLRPGGQLVAQCGGAGNIASVVAAIEATVTEESQKSHDGGGGRFAALRGWDGPWHFAGPEETRARLEAAGFVEIDTWLNDEPAPFPPGEPLESFLATVVLGAHLDRLPEHARAAFTQAVAARLPKPEIDYVRLNIVARRAL